jgi:hypothetical protein
MSSAAPTTIAATDVARAVAPPAPAPAVTPWEARPMPAEARVPSMLTDLELNYLHWLAAAAYRGAGRVVELGCFLGGSTAALVTGLAANPRATAPLLTYDAFILDEWSNRFLPTPYRPGESFRPLFDIHLRDRLDRITVREGWIPTDLARADEPSLYPEQEAIEILFIDAAKRPAVHHTILRCFGRHLADDAIVVQQDFKDPNCYWLPLDMTALGDCVEPVDSIPWSATLSFRHAGGLAGRLDALDEGADTRDGAAIEAAWDEVDERLAGVDCPELPYLLRLQRASHLFARGETDRLFVELERFVDRFDAAEAGVAARPIVAQWHRFLEIKRWQVGLWPDDRAGVGPRLERLQRRSLDGEVAVPEAPGVPAGMILERLWHQVAARCVDRGWRRIALYGGGAHTRRLLATGWPHGRVEIAAILDDAPPEPSLAGIPIARPADAPTDLDAIVLSSDGYESHLAERARARFGALGLPVVRVYTDAPR